MKKNEFDFLNFFVTMLQQGYDIDNILKLCQFLHYKKESQLITKYLNEGYTLQEALLNCHFSRIFQEYFQFFIHTFSISDAIEKTLRICEKKNQMKMTLIKKLTYPLFMIIFLFVFSIFIVTFLLPEVEHLFIDFNIEKSLIMTIVFTLFHIIPYFIFFTFFLIISLTFFVIYHVRKINYHVIDFLINKTYLISRLLKKYYSLKFAIYYDELLQNQYDATSIIEILYDEIEDSDIKMIVYELYHFIKEGQSLSESIRSFVYFEEDFKMFYLMMYQNQSQKTLQDYIQLVFTEIDQMISKFIKIAVPLIYGFVATFVIVIYISIILPMMNVITMM